MLRILAALAAFTSLSLAHASTDPEQSWNQAVDQRARDFERQQEAANNASKIQTKAERVQRAFELAAGATGEPAQAFTMKCIEDCTLKNSGTETYYMRIALQSRDKVCRYNAFNDGNEYAVEPAIECLSRIR